MEIELRNISKKFGQNQVLDNINLCLQEGLFGLLGANGAGKTTLIRILATLLDSTSGEILYDGNKISNRRELREKIGYIPQTFSFYPNMTVFETLDYLCSLSGIKKRKRNIHICELLEKVNLLEFSQFKTKDLSGGMRQRLGIAAALIGNPQLLLVDEPTVGLDPKERMKFRNVLVEFAKDRIVLMSTHIVSDIEDTCQNLAIMNHGQIVFQGTRTSLLQQVEGNVWEVILPDREQYKIEQDYIVTGKRVLNEGVAVRVLADKKPIQEAVCIQPNVQDAYMKIIDEDERRLQCYE